MIDGIPESEYKTYIATKVVKAAVQTPKPDMPGYHVVHEVNGQQEGYWCAKDRFEDTFKEAKGLTCGQAIEAMREGKTVKRMDWIAPIMKFDLEDLFATDWEIVE
jgi:hypothetical protein